MSKKELEYQKIGDFYLPKVSFPAEDEKIENIGKYGLLRLEYLKEHKEGYYTFLIPDGMFLRRMHSYTLHQSPMKYLPRKE